MRYTVVGIADTPHPTLGADAIAAIAAGRVFSGGRRHHDIVRHLLPTGADWIDITVPLDAVFAQYESHAQAGHDIVVFASGDPLFFGFASTLRRRQPTAEVVVYPTFNSLQTLAHRLVLPYHDMRVVSLTGRPWPEFDRALIEGSGKIGVLTDRTHTPSAIARRMLDYGYSHYTMSVGECLGNPESERVVTLSLAEASESAFAMPCCLILTGEERRPRRGIPDDEFALLDGRPRMITKMPIRLLSLQALDLPTRHVLWDIGFCTGSLSIEARLQHPHLSVVSFEIRPEGRKLIDTNARRFGAPGIDVHIGDFLSEDLSELPRPDAVFIGGHGGRLREMMERCHALLPQGGVMVLNSVSDTSREQFVAAAHHLGMSLAAPLHIALNDYNPIDILKCTK